MQKIKKFLLFNFIFIGLLTISGRFVMPVHAAEPTQDYLLDDRKQIDEYTEKFRQIPKDILWEMIKDDTLNPLKTTAALRVMNQDFVKTMVQSERQQYERKLLRNLSKSDSPFIQVETMYGICVANRYEYFDSMVPALIQKLNHYNTGVNLLAYENLNKLLLDGQNRPREARVVFNTLRKILFLSRIKLETITTPEPKLDRQLKILRWAIKVLGNQELQRLPREVIHLL
ncbi:MAG: hypothetical protein HQL25_04515 [Candidatus Omnitrophica bacterium]|nr:hypothetical protein [Candidatus Omnitrophota bacterium]